MFDTILSRIQNVRFITVLMILLVFFIASMVIEGDVGFEVSFGAEMDFDDDNVSDDAGDFTLLGTILILMIISSVIVHDSRKTERS